MKKMLKATGMFFIMIFLSSLVFAQDTTAPANPSDKSASTVSKPKEKPKGKSPSRAEMRKKVRDYKKATHPVQPRPDGAETGK